MKVVALADSDSYLKWAGSFLGSLPTPLGARAAARRDAGGAERGAAGRGARDERDRRGLGVVPVPLAGAGGRDCGESRPDVVLVATRGPVARVLLRMISRGLTVDRCS